MDTITLPKKIYSDLLEKAMRYQYVASILQNEDNVFGPPPVKSVQQLVKAFSSAGHYSKSFIASLEKGLKHSNYFQK